MNAERLKALVDRVLADENELELQQKLTDLNNALSTFSQQPGQASAQTAVADILRVLVTTLDEFLGRYSPAQIMDLESIGGRPFFSTEMIAGIKGKIDENPLTPAVVQQFVKDLMRRRAAYVGHLTALASALDAVGISGKAEDTGQGLDIGFKIPRALFDNDLDGLLKELNVIRQMVRIVSEIAIGEVETIAVKEISTTDPLFVFDLSAQTIITLGAIATWALHTWRQVEEIRRVRAETAKLRSFTEKEIEEIFGDKIKKEVELAVKAQATAMLGTGKPRDERGNEQRNGLEWVLRSVLARVERGWTVEIRPLAPPADAEGAEATTTYEQGEEIAKALSFPAPEPAPVLQLPPAQPPKAKSAD